MSARLSVAPSSQRTRQHSDSSLIHIRAASLFKVSPLVRNLHSSFFQPFHRKNSLKSFDLNVLRPSIFSFLAISFLTHVSSLILICAKMPLPFSISPPQQHKTPLAPVAIFMKGDGGRVQSWVFVCVCFGPGFSKREKKMRRDSRAISKENGYKCGH